MNFVEAVAVMRRHKLLVVYGGLVAVLLATFAAYRLDGGSLVSRASVVYESSAVVAVRPGAEQPTTTTIAAAVPSTAPPVAADVNATTVALTTVPTPPLAPLPAVVDSRAMYYTALSLKTIVISPGFQEAVRARAPEMDGSVTSVVAQDTNTMDIVVTGSTPAVVASTMTAALAELQSVVAAYSTTPATRFSLDGVVISAPSAPAVTTGIKDAMTFALVLFVAVVSWWFVIRAVDAVHLHRRATAGARRRPRGEGTGHGGPPDEPAPVHGVSTADRRIDPVTANGRAPHNARPTTNGEARPHDGTPSVPLPPRPDVLAAPTTSAVVTAPAESGAAEVVSAAPIVTATPGGGPRGTQRWGRSS